MPLGEERGQAVLAVCGGEAIPQTYKTDVPANVAVDDLENVLMLRESGESVAFDLWESESYVGGVPIEDSPAGEPQDPGDDHRVWRLSIYRTGSPITLTDVLPRLQHMGVDVVDEHPYEFEAAEPFWIYDFGLRRSSVGADASARTTASVASVKDLVQDALTALWHGDVEDDGFNALVLDGHLTWRQVVVLRAYAKYLRQAGSTFSQNYVERVLRSNITITRLLVRLFESRFDPERQQGEAERSEAITEEIRGELDEVESLDQDRILRAYWGLIQATLRTNYFAEPATPRPPAPYLVVKLDAQQVPDLPAPRPEFELFVYSPRFEAVHLRFAGVARGGLRWSDRREDFRTEILGLAKAQEVKNSVIVPSGSKGGFVCKQLPDPSDREAYQGEVLACYRTFISAMLDVTDNIEASRVVPPARVVRRDGDDAYLVVAADKGTATFSDTANEIAKSRGFWLGDAFASGGSEGYDHKKMGITARGAWESVKFHFQTMGIDVDTERLHRGRDRRHVRRRVRQRHAAFPAHQARGRVRSPARVPGSQPRPGGQLRRAAAAVRPAPLLLGGLRSRADLRGRRRVAADREVGAGLAAGPGGARPRGRRDRDAAGRADLRGAAGPGRSAVERRHRYLRQGDEPDPGGRGRPGQ